MSNKRKSRRYADWWRISESAEAKLQKFTRNDPLPFCGVDTWYRQVGLALRKMEKREREQIGYQLLKSTEKLQDLLTLCHHADHFTPAEIRHLLDQFIIDVPNRLAAVATLMDYPISNVYGIPRFYSRYPREHYEGLFYLIPDPWRVRTRFTDARCDDHATWWPEVAKELSQEKALSDEERHRLEELPYGLPQGRLILSSWGHIANWGGEKIVTSMRKEIVAAFNLKPGSWTWQRDPYEKCVPTERDEVAKLLGVRADW
jgi:hypothetical protein